jgi:hypothetical protein
MSTTEVWLSGPVPGVAPLLQPVAHALMAAKAEVEALAPPVPIDVLWERRGGAASAGFHLLHLAGALDRLFTYARGEALSDEQKAAARAEAQDHSSKDGHALVAIVSAQIERAMAQIRATDPATLLDERKIGRAGLPSTVIGCLFHGAEHSTRHAGQFISTVKILGQG